MKNNKYVLNDDVKKVITYAEYVSAQEVIAHTNQLINGSSFVINKSTKTAIQEFKINNSGKSVRVVPSTENSKIQLLTIDSNLIIENIALFLNNDVNHKLIFKAIEYLVMKKVLLIIILMSNYYGALHFLVLL